VDLADVEIVAEGSQL